MERRTRAISLERHVEARGLGLLGIYIEMTNPGVVLPGVVGGVCLLLFAFAAQVLPVNVLALLMFVGAVVLFILEVNVTSYGMLTLTGIVMMALGSLMMFDTPIPEMRVPLSVVVPMLLLSVPSLAMNVIVRSVVSGFCDVLL